MTPSPVVSAALRTDGLLRQTGAWTLLRKDTAPVALAVLGTLLRGENTRMPGPVLTEAIDSDLDELRALGLLAGERTAQHYLKTWVDERFLRRRVDEATRGENYELTEDALVAIRFVDQLATPERSATESRMETVLSVLHQLRTDTDPDVASRVAALTARKTAIEAEIAALESGQEPVVLSDDQARERAAEVVSLVAALPEDFARVRTELDRVNQELRTFLIEDVDSRGDVLEKIFGGIDLLNESDAGRSFLGFYAVLTDMARASQVEDDLDEILERDFADGLPPAHRHALRTMLSSLHSAANDIHAERSRLGRNLRQFVRSRDYIEERKVHASLTEATAEVRALLSTHSAIAHANFHLQQSAVTIGSIGALRLHDPAESAVVEDPDLPPPPPVDLAALIEEMRQSEIDMQELEDALAATLAARGDSTIGDVLAAHPATQGVASVVGLVLLAEERASRTDRTETVCWEGPGGRRAADVPLYLFREERTDVRD